MNFATGLRNLRMPSSSLSHNRRLTLTMASLYPVASRQSSISRSRTSLRHASDSAATAAAPRRSQTPSEPSKLPLNTKSIMTPLDATKATPVPISSALTLSQTLNPPASTRPPPLDIPVRDQKIGTFSYLVTLGKAYLNFYKSGLKAVFTNRRLLSELQASLAPPPGLKNTATAADTTVKPTRAGTLLRERTRHDLARVPFMGLLILVCGEFTPLIVLLFPKITPYTCRIPAQIRKLRSGAEARRVASFRALRHVDLSDAAALERIAPGHIARTLGLGGSVWDKVGLDVPFAKTKAARAVGRIVADDFMIRHGGGVQELEVEEVELATEDRGMDIRSKSEKVLREALSSWIAKTTKVDQKTGETVAKKLLCGVEEEKQ